MRNVASMNFEAMDDAVLMKYEYVAECDCY